jgi:membrane-associated HD superfamily phosphohydrolase
MSADRSIYNPFLILGFTGVIFIAMSFFLENTLLNIPIAGNNFKIKCGTINFLIGFYLVICNIFYHKTEHLLYLKLLVQIHLTLTVIGLVGIFIMTVSNEVFYDGYAISGRQMSIFNERLAKVAFLFFSIIIFVLGQSVYLFNLVVGISYIKQKKREDGTKHFVS